MSIRRVVVAKQGGKSRVVSDENNLSNSFKAVPGFDPIVLWGTSSAPSLKPDNRITAQSIMPAVGGTTLFVVTFPPDSVMMDPKFDPAAAGAEYMAKLPGLAELFEMENPGMHTTPTIDYDIVLEGEIWCELDDGQVVHLRQGDVMIQHGTRHGWRNKGSKPAKLAFVLIGGDKA